jgi:hypothetical protein
MTQPSPVGITSSTNASPIVVTTGSSHGYSTGDCIWIEGHATNTNANGLHTCAVLSPTTFSLTNTTGNGVGGATGFSINTSANPQVVVPSGGDQRNASSVASPLEGIFNFTPFGLLRGGQYRIWDAGHASGGTTFNLISSTSINGSTWTSLTGLTGLISTAAGQRYLVNGDRLRIQFQCGHDSSSCPSGAAIGFGIALDGGAVTALPASAVMTDMAGLSSIILPISLDYEYQYSGSTTGVQYSIDVMALSASGTHAFVTWGTYTISILHLRSNA